MSENDASIEQIKGQASQTNAEQSPEQTAADAPQAEPAQLPQDLSQRIEAALLTSDRAMSAGKLGEALGGLPGSAIKSAIEQLNETYESTGRSFRIEQVAGGFAVMTLPQYADVLAALQKTRSQSRLTPAAMETLAIVAYKQPIVRAEIESIRGVASGEMLRSLMDRHLIKIVGRAEELGRPMLYGTTKTFLEVFGLASLSDLPNVEQLQPRF